MTRPTALLVLLFLCAPAAADWPQFRGPAADGVYSGPPLPDAFGPDTNLAWKVPVPGKGWSSPAVAAGRVYLTTATPGDGRGDQSLRALCLDAASGKTLWDVEVFKQDGATSPKPHPKNSFASPSPVWDGQRLYVHFGHEGTAALDGDGKVVWTQRGLRYTPVHGNGGSPILVDNTLVFSIDGPDKQAVVALSRDTGEVVWDTPRDSTAVKKFSFCTPTLITHKGVRQILSQGSDGLWSLDPATGRVLWKCRYTGYSVVPKPVYADGRVYLSTSYDSPVVHAVVPEGEGDITDKAVAWTLKRGAPHNPSMVFSDGLLYMVSDAGQASAIDAATGEARYQERVGGAYSASLSLAGERLILVSEAGVVTVLKKGPAFEELLKVDLKERTLATPALSEGSLYIRTDKHLWRFAAKSAPAAAR